MCIIIFTMRRHDDQVMICPFDKTHKSTRPRLVFHLSRCPAMQKYQESGQPIYRCRYFNLHIYLSKEELEQHEASCEEKDYYIKANQEWGDAVKKEGSEKGSSSGDDIGAIVDCQARDEKAIWEQGVKRRKPQPEVFQWDDDDVMVIEESEYNQAKGIKPDKKEIKEALQRQMDQELEEVIVIEDKIRTKTGFRLIIFFALIAMIAYISTYPEASSHYLNQIWGHISAKWQQTQDDTFVVADDANFSSFQSPDMFAYEEFSRYHDDS